MAGTYDPLPSGFKDFQEARNIAMNGAIQPTFRQKLAASTNVIKKGHPLIVASTSYYDLAAVTGTNEVQTLTFAGTVTTFTLAITGRRLDTGVSTTETTALITYNADFNVLAANCQRALQLLANVGVDNITVERTSATVLTVRYKNFLSARNVAQITAPTVNGGGTVTPATGTAGVDGYITSTTLLGFADRFEKGSITNWQRQFAQPIDLNLDGEFWTDPLEMCIFPLRDQVFRASIEHDVAVALTQIGNTYPIGWNVDRSQCYIATQQATNAVATVVGVSPDQVGVIGGVVDFIITSAAIALL